MQQRRGELVNRPFIHSFNIHALRAGYSPGFVPGAGDTKINKPTPSRSSFAQGSQRVREQCSMLSELTGGSSVLWGHGGGTEEAQLAGLGRGPGGGGL